MSSAILYVAIVAIWIGVLVPRWLKHENSQSGLRRLSRHFGATRPAGETAARGRFDPDGRPRYSSFVPPESPASAPEGAPQPETHAPAPHYKSQSYYGEKVSSVASGNKKSMTELYEERAPRPVVSPYGWSADEVARQEHVSTNTTGAGARHGAGAPRGTVRAGGGVPAPRGPRHDEMEDAERRAQIVRGRRRMLVLTAVGIGLAYLGLAAWWVMVPPTVLLIGYLLLLREAAHADAEARERRELAHANTRPAPATAAPGEVAPSDAAAPAPAPAATSAEETGPRADIINLSEHVGDQLYDQYADAKLRAVGD